MDRREEHLGKPAGDPAADVRERGANGQASDRRLFMQFQAFGGCAESKPLVEALENGRVEAVLYHDLNDPRGVGVLTLSEDPAFFAIRLRDLFTAAPFAGLSHKPEFAMLGRTYSSGYEADLEDYLLRRPRRTALNPAWPWAVWYPLRRAGAFARLSPQEQGTILREHGGVGRPYAEAGLAQDIRLACHGLDVHDNDFVIGLIGPDLYPLSHLVQAMRKTIQTSQYLESLGPFFVGHAVWQSPAP
jgi:chlorite dismutase